MGEYEHEPRTESSQVRSYRFYLPSQCDGLSFGLPLNPLPLYTLSKVQLNPPALVSPSHASTLHTVCMPGVYIVLGIGIWGSTPFFNAFVPNLWIRIRRCSGRKTLIEILGGGVKVREVGFLAGGRGEEREEKRRQI